MPIKMKSFDTTLIAPSDAYQLLIGGIVPRPIAWISTQNTQGLLNLAPFSFFMGVSSNPVCIAVSFTRKADGSKKDTLKNIEETGQFVVNSVSRSLLQAMNKSSAEYEYGVSEFEKIGVQAIPSVKVNPPRVRDALVQFECETYRVVEVGEGGLGSSTLVIGKVLMVHVADSAYEAPVKPGRKVGRIRFDSLNAVARLGGTQYGFVNETLDLPRSLAD